MAERIGRRVQIRNGGIIGHKTTVEVDGRDISQHCQRVTLRWDADELNSVELELYVRPDIDTRAAVRIAPEQARLLVDLGWTAPPEGTAP